MFSWENWGMGQVLSYRGGSIRIFYNLKRTGKELVAWSCREVDSSLILTTISWVINQCNRYLIFTLEVFKQVGYPSVPKLSSEIPYKLWFHEKEAKIKKSYHKGKKRLQWYFIAHFNSNSNVINFIIKCRI